MTALLWPTGHRVAADRAVSESMASGAAGVRCADRDGYS
jgi:hypothetical protein